SLHKIDYEHNKIEEVNATGNAEQFINNLIGDIKQNSDKRKYTTNSNETEVLSCILSMGNNINNSDYNHLTPMSKIAKKLMSIELSLSERMRSFTTVQKGTLVQILIYNEDTLSYQYLLAKIEHGTFYETVNYEELQGFPKDKNKIWKTCLFEFPSFDETEYIALVTYKSKMDVKYWWEDFLEIKEFRTDEINTKKSINAIENIIKSSKIIDPVDKKELKRAFFAYYETQADVSINNMTSNIMDNFSFTVDVPKDEINRLKKELIELPEKKNFDG
ncbi:MAG: nucleoid-associated protein, partial [Oscillospiraceae bacterium]|nr:nucleoid-associated protein [Oscillospiraceae bacterium]